MRSKAGNLVAQHNELLNDWFGQSAEVRNYLEDSGQTDEYGDPVGDRTEHPDNPIDTTVIMDTPTSESEGTAWGIDQSYEAEFLVPDDVLLSDGDDSDSQGNELPYPSEITVDSRTWTVVAFVDEDNGHHRVAVRED